MGIVKINNIDINFGEPTFVIGEAGVNHNGHLEIAKRLVDVAKKAKCDAIKFQTFKESEIPYENLTYPEFEQIKEYCDFKKIMFLSTPHSLTAIDFLAHLVPAYKIASPFITKDYFIKKIRMKGKPIIASTGSITHQRKQATIMEVNHFLHIVRHAVILLYCVSEYPCYHFDVVNFSNFLERYSKFPVGLSCHYPGIEYSLEAVLAGACIIEKHITLDEDFVCPDKAVSIIPDKLEEMIQEIRMLEDER